MWFVPAGGYTAEKAIPQQRTNMANDLMCHDTYRNITTCTMKCKALQTDSTVTLLDTISAKDFNQSNCILNLNTDNSSFQYILEIPIDNYLIFFTNWTTDLYNFSCENSTEVTKLNMICRYEVGDMSVNSPQCPSNNTTSRYIRPSQCISMSMFFKLLVLDCIDTENWRNTAGFSCFEYEVTQRWCANGKLIDSQRWTGGQRYNYPERNCCACGKGISVSM